MKRYGKGLRSREVKRLNCFRIPTSMAFMKQLVMVSLYHLFLLTTNLDHADTILLFAADGHPKYIEQNKIDGNSFRYRRGAQIQYCEEIESWIFTHPDIETENECEWLFRSDQVDPETDFDVIAAAREPWTAWVGEAVFNAGVSIKCTTCVEDSDCSYQGNCKFFGLHMSYLQMALLSFASV